MSVTIPNLRDETISQARAEAQHLLAQAKETTISLNSTSTFRPSRTI